MSVLRLLGASAIAAAIGIPCFARAADLTPASDSLTLTPAPAQVASDSAVQSSASTGQQHGNSAIPQYLDAGGDAPNIHGFFDMPFKTAYVTPRGLVVENQGLVMQPVVGLVFPLDDIGPISHVAFITGVWNSINTNQDDHFVGEWNELDYFASLTGSIGKFTGTLTYSPWFFPAHAATIESTSDFKVAYDDTGMLPMGIVLKPYVDFFYDISGDSPVILGRHGSSYYFEFGVIPTYTFKGIENYPLTFTFQTYFSVGPKNFWDTTEKSSNFGVFSTSVAASVPLPIPIKYGAWHAEAALQYYYLLNHSLLEAGDLASGNNNRNVLNGSVGIGFNF